MTPTILSMKSKSTKSTKGTCCGWVRICRIYSFLSLALSLSLSLPLSLSLSVALSLASSLSRSLSVYRSLSLSLANTHTHTHTHCLHISLSSSIGASSSITACKFLKVPAVLELTNTDPFAAWSVVTGDVTPGGTRVVRSVLGAISSP